MVPSITRATVADADSIAKLARELGLDVWSPHDYGSETLRDDSIFLRARDPAGLIIGFIVGRVVPDSVGPGNVAEIYNLGVGETNQRSGLGSELLREFLAVCLKAQVGMVWLEVREGNGRARRFYERHGFVLTGTRERFYAEPDEDAVLMRLDLPELDFFAKESLKSDAKLG